MGEQVTVAVADEPREDQRRADLSGDRRARLRGVLRLVAVRIALAVFALWGAATAAFFALRLVPGDPAFAILGAGDTAVDYDPAAVAAVREEYHLNDPLLVQYFRQLGAWVHGDLGVSYKQQQPTVDLIREQLGSTLTLTAVALLLAVVISLVFVVSSAGRPAARRVFAAFELTSAAIPVFWLGYVLLIIFAFQLQILPSLDDGTLRAVILPAVALAIPATAPLAQILRAELEDVLEQSFIETARARGATERRVRLVHALPHAAPQYLTVLGVIAGWMIGGAVIAETLFNRPGIGRLLVQSASGQDLPVVIGVVLVCTGGVVLINLVVDLAVVAIDPSRRGGGGDL